MIYLIILLCFWLSGFAALLYQIAWMRLFSIAFGTSEISVVVVLAGYMAGLALGAAIAGRYINRVKSPVLVYGVLEGTIALAALAMPIMIGLIGGLYELMVGGQPAPPDAASLGQTLFYAVASMGLLLIPTALMGATLPLLAKYVVRQDKHLGRRVSALYSINTLGAVAGTVTAGFLLIPTLGLTLTVWVGVLVNFLIFLLAWMLTRLQIFARSPDQLEESKPADTSTSDTSASDTSASDTSTMSPLARFLLPVMLISGSLSFIYEVLWTRLLSHVLGSSVYAFSTMLAAFLTGIALGAGLAGGIAQNRQRSVYALALVQFGIALSSAGVYLFLQGWQPADQVHPSIAFAVILPSALFIGATYPLAVRALSSGPTEVGKISARVYAWNTLGAIFGALAAGFVIIPEYGFSGSVKIATLTNALLGVFILVIWYKTSASNIFWTSKTFWIKATPAYMTLLFLVFYFQPERPDALVMHAFFGGSDSAENQERYYAVGRSSTVLISENQYRFDLSTNGLPEAQVEFLGAPPFSNSQRWLGIWPSLARPDTSSMLIVGLGGGVVLEGVPSSLDQIDVVELEPEVLAANRAIADRRMIDPLSDDRLRIVINDARNALKLSEKTYDAIVSQPSHPWTAGASHLFTQEFFELVHSRLNEGGVFVQWMNAEFLDAELLAQLMATLNQSFDYVRVYQPSPLALHFLASDHPLNIEEAMIDSGAPLIDNPQHYATNGIASTLDVLSKLVLDEQGSKYFSRDARLITDDFNSMATKSRSLADGISTDELADLMQEFDPLLDITHPLRQLLDVRSLAYLTWDWLASGYIDRVNFLLATVEDQNSRILMQAMIHRYWGRTTEMQSSLEAISPESPLYEIGLFMHIENRLGDVSSGQLDLSDFTDLNMSTGTLYWVVEGIKLVEKLDWPGLYELESRLASVTTNSLWRPHALQLRATWRSQADDPQQTFRRQALELIDRAVVYDRTTPALLLRAGLGESLGDDPLFLESVAHAVQSVQFVINAHQHLGTSMTIDARQSSIERMSELRETITALNGANNRVRQEAIIGLIDSIISDLENS